MASFLIESFEINAKALQNKVYLHPLTDRETVAVQLSDLAFAYVLSLEKKSKALYEQLLAMVWEQLDEEYFKRLDWKNEVAKKILEQTGGIKL